MNWTETISLLALGVSALSLGVSAASFWRAYMKDQPAAWLEVCPLPSPNLWRATIHFRNQSAHAWRPVHAMVALDYFPVTDKQRFLIANVELGDSDPVEAAGKAFNFKASLYSFDKVEPGETSVIPLLLQRGRLSDAASLKMDFMVQCLKAKPKYSTIKLKADIRGASTMQLS